MPSPVNYSNFLKRGLDTINNQSDEKQLTHVKQCTTFGIPYHQLLHKLSLLSTKRVFEPNQDSCSIYFTKVNKNNFFMCIKQNQQKKYKFLTLKSSFPKPSVMCATKGRLRRSNCNKKDEIE